MSNCSPEAVRWVDCMDLMELEDTSSCIESPLHQSTSTIAENPKYLNALFVFIEPVGFYQSPTVHVKSGGEKEEPATGRRRTVSKQIRLGGTRNA